MDQEPNPMHRLLAFVLEHPKECPMTRMMFDRILETYTNTQQYMICDLLYGNSVRNVAEAVSVKEEEVISIQDDFADKMRAVTMLTYKELIENQKFGEFCELD